MLRLLRILCILPAAFGFAQGADDSASPKASTPVENSPAKPAHTNRLSKEKSPYLLQHQHNPVDWYPWCDEAFARAKRENKPVLLSIGYSTCHWCHVMERESFENEAIGKYLNEHFICIKLDREERPDVDNIYMNAMQSLGLGGGWPLNVFLTVDRKPFYGGTYFRPAQFRQILEKISAIWKTDQDQIVGDANEIARQLEASVQHSAAAAGPIKREWVERGAKMFGDSFDAKHGGFGDAPKFPQPQIPELLLLTGTRTGDRAMVDKVLFTCRRMAAGGLFDQIGGGFARYSVDEKWLVPHFEKMLYDNAQLVELYLNAYLITKDEAFSMVVLRTLGYVLRDMTHADGGFFSAEDADSEGHEGKFYTWSQSELKKILTEREFHVASSYFGITEEGNFLDHSHPSPLKNQNILHVASADKKLDEESAKVVGIIIGKLFEVREKRVRPHLDDKILTSWNGLMLAAISRAGAVLGDDRYLSAAKKNVAFVRAKLWDPATKKFYHRWRDGERDSAQLLSAYACYLSGLVELYQATLEAEYLEFAVTLAESMIVNFYDEKHGGFFTSAGQNDLLYRVKDEYDGAEPSANSVAIFALLKLAAITENEDFQKKAEASLKLFSPRLEKRPQAVPLLLQAADFSLEPPMRVVIVGDSSSDDFRALLRAAHSVYQPSRVILGAVGPVEPFAKTLQPKEGRATAFICTGTSCKPPVTEAAAVRKLLERKAAKGEK